MILNNIKIALRNLLKTKMFSFINIAGLAAGLSCCMLICLYIRDELSYDTQHPDVAQLYQVQTVFVNGDGEEKKRLVRLLIWQQHCGKNTPKLPAPPA